MKLVSISMSSRGLERVDGTNTMSMIEVHQCERSKLGMVQVD